AESYADGLVDRRELGRHRAAGMGVASGSGSTALRRACRGIPSLLPFRLDAPGLAEDPPRTATDLLRDAVGNPFRLRLALQSWLAGNDRAVVQLARGIYDDRAFERLPILGDALEEAGFSDDVILTHCRGTAVHVRGYWVVDLMRTAV